MNASRPTHNLQISLVFLILMVETLSSNALAWGKRGHSIVCQAASELAAAQPKGEFLKTHSFDLGYYCNVPDLVWKRPETYQQESFNHFMDMEIFKREIPEAELDSAFALDRLSFSGKYPKIADKAGRSFWRIRELLDEARKIAEKLKAADLQPDARHALQADWLVHVGAIGHYVGDLSQPLHVTENYDGQMTEQKGVHAWFEDDAVDQLFHSEKGAGLESEVRAAAHLKWKKLKPGWEKQTPLAVINELAKSSNAALIELLAIDKKIGRKNLPQAAEAYHKMIIDRMSSGAVALAELWSQSLGWDYDGKKFFNFVSEPGWISPPQPKTAQPPAL